MVRAVGHFEGFTVQVVLALWGATFVTFLVDISRSDCIFFVDMDFLNPGFGSFGRTVWFADQMYALQQVQGWKSSRVSRMIWFIHPTHTGWCVSPIGCIATHVCCAGACGGFWCSPLP